MILRVFGEPILSVEPPEEEGAPFRLSGVFCDDDGTEIFRIKQNEWYGSMENFDIEIVGRRLTIRRTMRKISLQIQVLPPDIVVIEKIDMLYKGCGIIGDKDTKFEVNMSGGARLKIGASAATSECAYDLTEEGIAGNWHGTTRDFHIQAGGGKSVTLRINANDG